MALMNCSDLGLQFIGWGKTGVCRKQVGSWDLRSESLIYQVLHFQIIIDNFPRNFVLLGLVLLNTHINWFWIH